MCELRVILFGPIRKLSPEELQLGQGVLLKKLFASEYSRGARHIARVCLLWKLYEHPEQEHILNQLYATGSKQTSF